MLRATWEQDGARREHVAFNDVVLSRVPGRGQALLALHVDGQLLVRYASDGVIAATPAGSTAYSYAAGGPIVSPQTRAMIVTPDAPHGLFNRAVVLGAEERLGVEVLPNSAPVAVEVDGQLLGRGRPGLDPRHHPEPVAGARRAPGLGGLRRARAAQARHHRPRRAGQLRLRRPRALSGEPLQRAAAARSPVLGQLRVLEEDDVVVGAGGRDRVPHALERLLEVVGVHRDLEDAQLVGRPHLGILGQSGARAARAPARREACRGAGGASRPCVVAPLRQSCPMSAHDRVAVVTGAGSGLGREVTHALLGAGYRVALAGRREDALRETLAGADVAPDRAIVVPTDVTDRDAVAALFARVRDELGPRRRAVQQRRGVRPAGALRGRGLRGLAGDRRDQPHGRVRVRAGGLPGDEGAVAAGRADHQQRLDLRSRRRAPSRSATRRPSTR